VKINLLKGRLGKHRFHPMLVHFPTALYPFSLVMDILNLTTGNNMFGFASLYALEGAIGMSVLAAIFGALDFLQIDSQSKPWKKAGLHALLNVCWLMVFAVLLFYRIKHPEIGWGYISITAGATVGLFVSNYLGADLIIHDKIGIDDH
jgi:uncharacterized membrane protein